ncbi:4Fe-4S ferredoxin, nitrogenase-associated [Mesorhizobium amorphae CCNWGS0123]|uniref:4Fe-4S ferredoxin, nitrogenase-associated n=1 Tax=Mesorhizobium amorphae CCNWGS0123 TaxID=1082933 RepID=G6Y3R9_9HYPH|nr:4Fe-4S ferredoxin, nitrogenase-associated [Mesorhizobium amorphae CCNWGS0123]
MPRDLPVNWTEIKAIAEKQPMFLPSWMQPRQSSLPWRVHDDDRLRHMRRSRWTPQYLTAVDGTTCIGCGRCFKVCSREVVHLYGGDDAGEILGVCDGEDDDFDGELNRMIMNDAYVADPIAKEDGKKARGYGVAA